MRILATLLFALLIGGGGTFLWLYYGGFEGEKSTAIAFIDVYGEYSAIANSVESLVHLPGTKGNTERSELLALLNSILTEDLEPERRATLARLAFANLDGIKKEIDSAQIAQAKLYQVLQDLDNASREFSSIELRGHVEEIVTMARKRAELSAHITSILSEINEQTYAIITRILADEGALSAEHVSSINSVTADAEKRFVLLEGLYVELVAKKEEMDKAFVQFTQQAL
jgi:hypothetical protein